MADTLRNPNIALLVGVGFVVAGSSTFNVLPLLTAAATVTAGLSEPQVGMLSSAIALGSGAGALWATALLRWVNWRRVAMVALGLMIMANGSAVFLQGYGALLLLQGMAGLSATCMTCLGLTILSERQNAASGFGVAMAMQVTYQVAAFSAGPALLRFGGLNGLLLLLVATGALALLLTPWLPPEGRSAPTATRPGGLLQPATLVGLTGLGVFFVNTGAYWTYVDLIGRSHGLTPSVSANCVSAGVATGISGGIAAWALGDRLGRVRPLCVATALIFVAMLLLAADVGVTKFLTAGVLYCFSWNYALSYQYAIISAVDKSGRGMAASMVFTYAGAAAGAALAALLVDPGHYDAVLWIALIGAGLSTVLFAFSSALAARAQARAVGGASRNT